MGSICDDSLRPPLTTHVSRETLPLKRVRITLPPSPPPDVQMSQNSMEISPSQPRRSQRTNLSNGGRVVLPTDHVDEQEAQHRLRSGSKWRQHDLALFKVKFEPNEDSELPMLNIEHEWNLSQRQRTLPPLSRGKFIDRGRSRCLSSTTYVYYSRDVKGAKLPRRY